MNRALVLAAVALAAASSLEAQGGPAAPAAKAAAKSPGAVNAPAGWSARFDKASADPAAAKFFVAGTGLHFTTGPSATWFRTEPVDGLYTVQATFTQTRAPQHPESYGLMVFGQQMDTPTQNYIYFMVRGDGKWAMKHRANDTDVHTVQDWTAHPALVAQDAAGAATNTLTIDVGADSVRFQANGQTLKAMSREYLKDVSGRPGIRMNHGLDVHVEGWAVTKKK